MRRLFILMLLIECLYLSSFAAGHQQVNVVASFSADSPIVKLERMNDILIVAEEQGVINIFNIADLQNPLLLSQLQLPYPITTMAIGQNSLFAAHQNQKLSIVNISNPGEPQLSHEVDISGIINDICVSGNFMFLAASYNGVYVVNISNPETPEVVTNLDTGGFAYRLFSAGNWLYLASGWEGLKVIDIKNPFGPHVVGEYPTASFPTSLNVYGHLAFITEGTSGLEVVDCSEPTAPQLLFSDAINPAFYTLLYQGSLLVFGNELRIFNIANLRQPRLLGTCDVFKNFYYGIVKGNYIIVSFKNKGWAIMRLEKFGSILPLSTLNTGRYLYSMDRYANALYVGTDNTGFQVIDVSDPHNPSLRYSQSYYPTYGGIPSGAKVKVVDNSLFLLDENGGLIELDLANPFLPSLTNRYWGYSGNALGLGAHDDMLLLACGFYGLRIIDRENLIPIAEFERSPMVSTARDIVVNGSIVYLIDDMAGLLVYDVSDPTSPSLLNQVEVSRARRGKMFGDDLYLACSEYGVYIYDLSVPELPTLEGYCPTFYARDIDFFNDDLAFVADGNGGLCLLDISAKGQPQIISRYRFDKYESLESLAIKDNLAYLAYGKAGLIIVSLDSLFYPTAVKPTTWSLYY